MVRRTGRLLKSAMRAEVRTMPCSRLSDLAKARKSLVQLDPLLSDYHALAQAELSRRKALKKQWGVGKPSLSAGMRILERLHR